MDCPRRLNVVSGAPIACKTERAGLFAFIRLISHPIVCSPCATTLATLPSWAITDGRRMFAFARFESDGWADSQCEQQQGGGCDCPARHVSCHPDHLEVRAGLRIGETNCDFNTLVNAGMKKCGQNREGRQGHCECVRARAFVCPRRRARNLTSNATHPRSLRAV